MTVSRFLIPTLVAAGFGYADAAQIGLIQAASSGGSNDPNGFSLLRLFSQEHYVTLAQHRSHSSHSSHSSHRSGSGGHYSHASHRSSAGGYDGYDSGSYTLPVYTPPAPPPPPPPSPFTPSRTTRATPPPASGLPVLRGGTARFASIVRRVQLALMGQGLYTGKVDGIVGPILRASLRRFQTNRKLQVTGTITPETLDSLMISSS